MNEDNKFIKRVIISVIVIFCIIMLAVGAGTFYAIKNGDKLFGENGNFSKLSQDAPQTIQ